MTRLLVSMIPLALAKFNSSLSSVFEANVPGNYRSLCTDLVSIWMACSWKSNSHRHHPAEVLIFLSNDSSKGFSFSLLAFDSREHARCFLLLSTFGGYSLFPLIFTGPGTASRSMLFRHNRFSLEIPIKISLFIAYTSFLFYALGEVHG